MAVALDTSAHIAALERHAHRLADRLEGVDPARAIPACPGWQVRDLARHVGGLHRWSTALVRDRVTVERWRSELPIDYPDATDAWTPWLREGIGPMLQVFSTVPALTQVWAWGADQHARSWPRRMLFETVVHDADAAMALDQPIAIDTEIALDGIDEFLTNLPFAARWSTAIGGLRGHGESIVHVAAETGTAWRVRLDEDGWWWDRVPPTTEADAVVEAAAAALLLVLQGRDIGNVLRRGDQSLLDRWFTAIEF